MKLSNFQCPSNGQSLTNACIHRFEPIRDNAIKLKSHLLDKKGDLLYCALWRGHPVHPNQDRILCFLWYRSTLPCFDSTIWGEWRTSKLNYSSLFLRLFFSLLTEFRHHLVANATIGHRCAMLSQLLIYTFPIKLFSPHALPNDIMCDTQHFHHLWIENCFHLFFDQFFQAQNECEISTIKSTSYQ